MKRIIALLLVLLFATGLAACKKDEGKMVTYQKGVETLNKDAVHQSKDLIVTFSYTGNTIDIASHLSAALIADMTDITPKQPYTDEDVDISNDNCRAKLEADDDTARPEISSQIQNFENYSTIYIGFPIWYNKAPKIIYTFLERYDFSGKTVYLFCTSDTDSMKNAFTELKTTYGKINIANGRRFKKDASYELVKDWLVELGELKE